LCIMVGVKFFRLQKKKKKVFNGRKLLECMKSFV